MNIKFLGTGGAFDFDKGTAAAIVDVSGKKILIDCGYSTILKLAEKDVAKDIDYILVTHLHGDHIGSLPTFLQYAAHRLGGDIPPIIVPTESFQSELETFFASTYVTKHVTFVPITEFSEIGHIDTSGQHDIEVTSFAYYFTEDDHLIYYSGDISSADTAAEFLATRAESKIQVFHETSPRTDIPVHTSYKEVAQKLGNYEIYVYHIAKENMPDDCTLTYIEDHPKLLL